MSAAADALAALKRKYRQHYTETNKDATDLLCMRQNEYFSSDFFVM